MTKQQIFNRVVMHLLRQNRKAVNGSHCRYRAPNGTKCAFGCLIPDKYYNEKMEGMATHGVFRAYPELAEKLKINQADFDFIYILQSIHDLSCVENWKQELIKVGKNHGLKIPKILKV